MEKIKTAQGKNTAFTYAKIFVDFFADTTGEPEEETTNFLRKYIEEWDRLNTQTKKYFIEWLEAWNFHTYANLFEKGGYNIKENIIAYKTADGWSCWTIKKGGIENE